MRYSKKREKKERKKRETDTQQEVFSGKKEPEINVVLLGSHGHGKQ